MLLFLIKYTLLLKRKRSCNIKYMYMFFGIIFPLVLFLFRYILTAEFEKALTKKTKEKKQILIEIIHFPIEYLMLIQDIIKEIVFRKI